MSIAAYDPWKTTFGFYWYNDREIFEFTAADHRARAASLADNSISHVITFSCTHFRWSFRRYWPQINRTIKMIVDACHRYGIAVTEHHSSHLTFNPLNAEEDRYMDQILAKRQASRDSWPGLRADCDEDTLIRGKPISSFRQIDGRTGDYARTGYRGFAMCFNNPDYRQAYLGYLDSVYDTGVDGIMTDDVQYFGLDSWQMTGHACACRFCREKFEANTGHKLPEAGLAWQNWHGDYTQDSFGEWIMFKSDSITEFHSLVAEHYEELGLRLLRPNYCSTVLNCNPTSYVLETLPRLDWIFQENCFSSVISHSWPAWAVEAAHRSAVAARRRIPAMSMFYPGKDDTMEFTWALAKSWGHMYLATPEGQNAPEMEKPLRRFEASHSMSLKNPGRVADICFYDSRENRLLNPRTETVAMPELRTWAQACYFANLQWKIVQDVDGMDYDQVLVLNDVEILRHQEVQAILAFIDQGGTVIATGTTAPGLERDGIITDIPDNLRELCPIGVINIDRWSSDAARAQITIPDYKTVHRPIVDFLKNALPGDPRIETICPEGLLVSAFVPDNGKLVLHVVNTIGLLSGGRISHDTVLPLEAIDTDIVIRVRSNVAGHTSKSPRAYTLDGEIPLSYRENALYKELTFPGSSIGRYAMIELE